MARQSIRLDQDAPFQYVIGRMGQHTGAGGTDTSWLSVKVGEEPDWLTECGGSLAKVRDLLAVMDE